MEAELACRCSWPLQRVAFSVWAGLLLLVGCALPIPEAAIVSLHHTVTVGLVDPDDMFAIAELSFRHAEDTHKRAYYLAVAVYAFAYLFPDDPAQRPSGFDPRMRTAATSTTAASCRVLAS